MLILAISSQVDVGFNNIDEQQALNLVSIFKQKDQMQSVGLAGCKLGIHKTNSKLALNNGVKLNKC